MNVSSASCAVRHVPIMIAAASIILTLAGCQRASSNYALDWNSPAFAKRLGEVRDQGITPDSARVASMTQINDASMQALVDYAIANNPEIKAARLRIERLYERIEQARALDDPMASLTAGELAQTAAGQVDYIVGLSQALPFPGTLDARAAVAEQDALTASSELLEDIERITAEVRRVYWRRYSVVRAIEVTEQDQQILKQITDVINAKARVGEAEQADQLRVSLQSADLDQELDRLRQQLQSLDAMLNRLLNRSTNAVLPLPSAVEWQSQKIDRSTTIEEAERNNPAVQVQRRRVEGFRRQLQLAKSERLPDFRLGVQYAAVGNEGIAGSANGEDQFAVTGAISIPLYTDKYDAKEREALRGIGEAIASLDAAQGRAANLAEDALARMSAEESILKRLTEQMLPDSERTFELSLTGYSAGNVSFIQMMDDWQRTLDFELAVHRAHSRYEQARADLAAAMGEISKGEESALQNVTAEGAR